MRTRHRFWWSLSLSLWAVGGSEAVGAAPDRAAVEQAIRRGTEYLRSICTPGAPRGRPASPYANRFGAVALSGLAMLEGGVAPTDPAVAAAVERVRRETDQEQQTYDLALGIMLLDNLTRRDAAATGGASLVRGDVPRARVIKCGRLLLQDQVTDSDRILRMGERLRMGQGPQGTWLYSCSPPSDGDHSNTQFGVLGLWLAGQHGLDVRENLQRCARHFIAAQSQQGGWAYRGSGNATPTMTCAGLIGLATALGLQTELSSGGDPAAAARQSRPRPAEVRRALALLEQYLSGGGSPGPGARRRLVAQEAGLTRNLYFVWSVERVGVLYGLERIGAVDWYAWGAAALLESQQADGSWALGYPPDVDTSFALLFLNRSNISPELTLALGGKPAPGGSVFRLMDPSKDMGAQLSRQLAERFAQQAAGGDMGAEQMGNATVPQILRALNVVPHGPTRTALIQQLAASFPTYSEVEDVLGTLWTLAGCGDGPLAAAARAQLANAFQRAPIAHCLTWLGKGDDTLNALIWRQLDGRIARADAARRAGYDAAARQVLQDGQAAAGEKAAAQELLRRLKPAPAGE